MHGVGVIEKKAMEFYSINNLSSVVQAKLADERMDIDSRDEKIQRRRALLSEMIRMAVSGDVNSKNYVRNRILKILINECKIDADNINNIINFNDIMSLSYYYKFQILMSRYDIRDLINKYNDEFKIIDFSGKGINVFTFRAFDSILEREVKASGYNMGFTEKINTIANIIYAEVYGLSVIDCLEFMDINEIGVNGCKYIWIQHRGCKVWLEFLDYEDNNVLNNVCKNSVSFNSKFDLSPSNPGVICQRYDGSRITCSLQPFYSEPTLNLRRFNLGNFDVDRLVNLGTIDPVCKILLELLVKGRANIIISGSMGDGKSTSLMALVNFIPDSRAIGTIEENFELRLKARHPSKNIIEAQAVPGKDISNAFEFMLKQSRDIIILGEITNHDEATLLINVMLRLCRGSMGTFHSESPRAVVINLRNLLLKSGYYRNEMVAQADVIEAVNVVIHMNHDNHGNRFVEYISEIVPVNDGGSLVKENFEIRNIMERESCTMGTSVQESEVLWNSASVKGHFSFRNAISEGLFARLVKYGAPPDELARMQDFIKKCRNAGDGGGYAVVDGGRYAGI